jgi:hypothetical protein
VAARTQDFRSDAGIEAGSSGLVDGLMTCIDEWPNITLAGGHALLGFRKHADLMRRRSTNNASKPSG